MIRTLLLALVSLPLLAQIPEVEGKPSEAFALRFIDIHPGSGAPAAAGKRFVVHYTGWLTDGKKFDSSLDRNEPIDFVQGRRQVIAGWDSGFEGMKVGGKRRLFIPYPLAYGEKGSGTVIPPKADLVFDVELLDVKDVPETPPAADILLSLNEAAEHMIQLARSVPEEKYGWAPAPGVRTFAQVFLHVANGNALFMNVADGKPVEDTSDSERKPHTKQELVKLLEESFAGVRASLEKERAGALGRDVLFFKTPTTRRGVFVSLDSHVSEHLGQLIAYARINGITPPWSK